MAEEILKITLENWQINSGIVGMYNILKHSGKDILNFSEEYTKDNPELLLDSKFSVFFPMEYLEDFTYNYYKYFIDTYFEQISYGRIVNFKEEAKRYINIEDENLTKDKLEKLNNYIKNVLTYYMKSNSYKSAFKLIDDSEILLSKVSEIKSISLKKKENILDKKEEIIDTSRKIVEVIEILEREEYRNYLGGKNIIYTIINKNWDGVSVLNRQVKEKDIYIEYNNYFVNPAINYLKEDKEKYKYNCFACGSKIKNLDNSISFLTHTGFDTARKTSHVWDFQNDIAICDFCKLIYSCIPAGFNYGGDRGVFINANSSKQSLLDVNSNLKENFFKDIKAQEQSKSYKSVVKSILDSESKGIRYELSDVQVVFYENNRYKFNILSKEILNLIDNCKHNFEYIKFGYLKENRTNLYIYEESLKKLLNNQNLFLWINKLIHSYISDKNQCFYTMFKVFQILLINSEYLKGVGLMEDLSKKDINDMRLVGWHIRQEYKGKNSIKKIDGITYKLLNALKTSNANDFLDILVRCFMYVGKEIPKSIIGHLENSEKFKTLGYAFVIGLNGASKAESGNKIDNSDDTNSREVQ